MNHNITVKYLDVQHRDSDDVEIEIITTSFIPKIELALKEGKEYTLHLVVGNAVDADGNRKTHIVEGNLCPSLEKN